MSTVLEPYGQRERCPKCGVTFNPARRKSQPRVAYLRPQALYYTLEPDGQTKPVGVTPECLRLTCRRCEFQWETQCADAPNTRCKHRWVFSALYATMVCSHCGEKANDVRRECPCD